jgi:hypothetical protein
MKPKPIAAYGLLTGYAIRDLVSDPHDWKKWLCAAGVVAMAIHAIVSD